MKIVDKLIEIGEIISKIEEQDPASAGILREGFALSLDILQKFAETGARETIDISEHLDIVCNIMGVDLKDLVMHILQTQNTDSSKEVDKSTLEFITSDLDDYEKFLASSKAKADLDFLSKEI